jgi:hypothetical protein
MTWYTSLPTSTRNAHAIHLLHQVYFKVMVTDPIILKHCRQSPHRMLLFVALAAHFIDIDMRYFTHTATTLILIFLNVLFASSALAQTTTNIIPPSIVGNLNVGSTLTANVGTWTNSPALYTCTWYINDQVAKTNTACNTGSTFTIRNYDLGEAVALSVLAAGAASPVTTALQGPISRSINQATAVSMFQDSFGVNAHLMENYSGYTNTSAIVNALSSTGINHVRTPITDPAVRDQAVAIAAAGSAKFDVEASYCGGTGQMDWVTAHAGIVDSVEGSNEADGAGYSYICSPNSPYNAARNTTEAEQYASQTQVALWQKFAPAINVFSFTVTKRPSTITANYPSGQTSFANYINYASSHAYPMWSLADSGANTYDQMLLVLNRYDPAFAPVPPQYTSIATRWRPNAITETGFWTQPVNPQIPRSVQANLTLEALLDGYLHGSFRTFIYELLDEYPDPNCTPSNQSGCFAGSEWHFGLFASDWTPKAAATAMQNLKTILNETGTIASPGTLSYTLSNMPSAGLSLLLERSDGTFFVVLWNDAQQWKYSGAGGANAIGTYNVTLNLGVSATTAMQSFEPTIGTSPIITGSASTITVSLGADPIFIKIVPPAPDTTPPSVPAQAPPDTRYPQYPRYPLKNK